MLPVAAPAPVSSAGYRRVLRDILAWLPLVGLLALTHPGFKSPPDGRLLASLALGLAAWVGGVYVNHLVLVPRFFDQGRYLLYTGALLGWVLVLHLALRGVEGGLQASPMPWFQPGLNVFGQLLLAMPFLLMWRAVTQRRQLPAGQLLMREQQLRLLEAQVNPHFFSILSTGRQPADAGRPGAAAGGCLPAGVFAPLAGAGAVAAAGPGNPGHWSGIRRGMMPIAPARILPVVQLL